MNKFQKSDCKPFGLARVGFYWLWRLVICLFMSVLASTAFSNALDVSRDSILRDPTLRDPTKPLRYTQGSVKNEPRLVLQAVYANASKPRVVINGQIASIGERVGGWRVSKIYDNTVVLQRESVRKVLKLHGEIVRR